MIKRAQAAAGAAVLLAIIAGILIMFILFLPPTEREELLGGTNRTATVSATTPLAAGDVNLLIAQLGRIDYLGQRELEHPLPVINIYTTTESQLIAEKNLASAKRAVFSEEFSTFTFPIADLEHTDNILLSFTVQRAQGKLKLSINGEELFYGDVEPGAMTPLSLPKNSLKDSNTIEVRVSSPGIAFWASNEVTLSNLKVAADVTNLDARSSRHIFQVSDTEKRNVEKVQLRFQPQCLYNDVSALEIEINGHSIYSAVPECDVAMVPIEFSADVLQEGENNIVFHTEKGTYILSHVQIKSTLKEIDFPTYYFSLSSQQYNLVRDHQRKARLTMDFVDVSERKFGELVFNGNLINFDTREVTYTADVSDDVVRNNNALKVRPLKTLEIRELRVDLVR